MEKSCSIVFIFHERGVKICSGLKLALGWNRWNMDLIGIWPDPHKSNQRWPNFKALISVIVIVVFGVGPQSINLLFIWEDLELVTENLSTANIPGMNALLKLIFAWHHRDSTYKGRNKYLK